MSFLSVLKQVGGVVQKAGPVLSFGVGLVNGPAGNMLGKVIDGIGKAEAAFNDVPKAGAQKLDFVQNEFAAGLTIAEELLESQGMKIEYDADALKVLIQSQVATFNALARLRQSFKVQHIGAVPAASTPLTRGETPYVNFPKVELIDLGQGPNA